MVPDRQKVRTDGRNGRTDDAKTIFLRLRRGIIKAGHTARADSDSDTTKTFLSGQC